MECSLQKGGAIRERESNRTRGSGARERGGCRLKVCVGLKEHAQPTARF